MQRIENKVFGGMLLVAGTTIGAAMLALPIVTGLAGFLPTIVLLLLYWAYMTFTAFLMLEVNLWLGENVNLITMAKKTLGWWGEVVSWATYLFLLYFLTTAYLAGGGPIVADLVYTISGFKISSWAGALPLLAVFGFFVYEGTKYVDMVNRWLMLGLAVSYCAMIFFLFPYLETSNLMHSDWKYSLIGVSLVATSFGFHIIIPTLTTYMHHNVRMLKKAIFYGSLVPLVVYILWEFIAMGVIPVEGESGLIDGYQQGTNGVRLLVQVAQHRGISVIAQFFSFFAIITSFLGVTLSLSDFLADGLHIKKNFTGRILIFIITFLPPLIFIMTDTRPFITGLELAGVFGVVILLGLLPPLMVWAGRYQKGMVSPYIAPGGKGALIFAILFSFLVIGVDIANKIGLIDYFILNH